jgi:hypothetical protein
MAAALYALIIGEDELRRAISPSSLLRSGEPQYRASLAKLLQNSQG